VRRDYSSGVPRFDTLKEALEYRIGPGEIAPERGAKHDDGKPDYTLLPLAALEPVVRVLEHGERKYSRDNWQHVPEPQRRYLAAALRHLAAHQRGEALDPESGQPHLAHAACCLIFLLWFAGR